MTLVRSTLIGAMFCWGLVELCAATTPEPPKTIWQTQDVNEQWRLLGTEVADALGVVDGAASYVDASQKWGDPSPRTYLWWEVWRRKFRETGLRLWQQTPNNPGRFGWLAQTVWMAPEGWLDLHQGAEMQMQGADARIPIDTAARRKWQAAYVPMRAEYMASPTVPADQKMFLRYAEAFHRVLDARHAVERGERIDLTDLVNWVLDPGNGLRDSDVYDLVNVLFYCFDTTGDVEMQKSITRVLSQSKSADLRIAANGFEQRWRLRGIPMQLDLTGFDGKKISLASLRGKVVLLDIWHIYCSACIEAMPMLESVYEKYKDRGFVVVGVCLTADKRDHDRAEAEKLFRKLKITYPNGLVAGKEDEDLRRRFAIEGAPVHFLLDQSGKLVSNVAFIRGPRLDNEVKRLLAANQVTK